MTPDYWNFLEGAQYQTGHEGLTEDDMMAWED